MKTYHIVVLEGDGIGPEIIDATLQVLEAVEQKEGDFHLDFQFYPAGAEHYRQTGTNLSPAAFAACQTADAVLKGPMGLPEVRNPDGTEAGILGGVLRRGLDLYANVRPIRLFPEVNSALAGKTAGDINYVIVRENTEGMYFSRGRGEVTPEGVRDIISITRAGTERVVRFAFELARKRQGAPRDGVKRVTCVDKSNVLRSFVLFRQVFQEIGATYPDIEKDFLYADAAAQALVLWPERFDVIVCENFLGDILSDLGAATAGGLGFCPGANVGAQHAVFETTHGSAPSLAGKDKANPIAAILAGAMLLERLGEKAEAELIVTAVETVCKEKRVWIDSDGCPIEGTRSVAEAVVRQIERSS
ncbi:MAG: isocitrate/isopropylmalate dehydrogenase family protein [Deltaproteobacteria bacterium]|nr:isocitrate/isopropylmalate dehydrogenase family protein [Deltaproteobacteria bacterium]